MYTGVYHLALFNVFSVLAWGYCLWSHFYGNQLQGGLISIVEVLAHAVACVIFLGWEAGFQIYIFCMPILTFFVPWLATQAKVLLVSIFCGIYVYTQAIHF